MLVHTANLFMAGNVTKLTLRKPLCPIPFTMHFSYRMQSLILPFCIFPVENMLPINRSFKWPGALRMFYPT